MFMTNDPLVQRYSFRFPTVKMPVLWAGLRELQGVFEPKSRYDNHYVPNVIKLTNRFVTHREPFRLDPFLTGVRAAWTNRLNGFDHQLPEPIKQETDIRPLEK